MTLYDRYGREEQIRFVRASMDDSPLPPPPRSAGGQSSAAPPSQSSSDASAAAGTDRPPETAPGKGLLEALRLDDLDSGDLLVLLLLFFLFRQQADEELLIALGLLLIL